LIHFYKRYLIRMKEPSCWLFLIFVTKCFGVSLRFSNSDLGFNTSSSLRSGCYVSKSGTSNGEATLFQDEFAYGNACGFKNPNTRHAAGYYAAVGGKDWDRGYGCGACVQLTYKGRKVVVNAVDRCGGCSDGWFDMGGAAWYDLTNNMPPGHVYGVKSRWVSCPDSLTGGKNIHVYVKPGSQPWDARFQPHYHEAPVTGMSIRIAGKWIQMKKCENFMFCKPRGYVLNGRNSRYALRVHSKDKNVDVEMSSIPDGTYVDTGSNNGPCQLGGGNTPAPENVAVTAAPVPTTAQVTQTTAPPSADSCQVDGLFPDPDDCSGFIKCAQGTPYKGSCGNLYFDIAVYNCNWPAATKCGSRPKPGNRVLFSQTPILASGSPGFVSPVFQSSNIWNQVYSAIKDHVKISVESLTNY